MLKVDHISKNYGRVKPIKDLSFSLNRGEVLGFLGANGAGKSTTLNMIAGYFPPSSGKIALNGFDILQNPLEYKRSIGYLPEVPPLYPDMTIYEQLEMVCSVKGISRKERNKEIERVCRMSLITDVTARLIKTMSKGYKQRIGLAQALIGSPDLLILDEPTSGLDPRQIIEIRKLIKDLAKDHGIIISSHILSEIASVSTRILVLNGGLIAADSPADKLLNTASGAPVLMIRIHGKTTGIGSQIQNMPQVISVESDDCVEEGCIDYTITLKDGSDIRKELSRTIQNEGCSIMLMKMKNPTLEEVFIELTTKREK